MDGAVPGAFRGQLPQGKDQDEKKYREDDQHASARYAHGEGGDHQKQEKRQHLKPECGNQDGGPQTASYIF